MYRDGRSTDAMTEYRGVWSRERVESFLEDTAVPLRLACRTPTDRLWLVSLWFQYRDETFLCATSRHADVVSFLQRSPHAAFEVSTNRPPYKGVRGNGVVTIRPDQEKTLLTELLERYLGDTESELAGRLLEEDREEVRLELDPDVISSWDFTDRMSDGHE